MQIYEITQPPGSEMSEGLLDTVQAAFSRDPRMANMSLAQKAQVIRNSQAVDQVSKKAFDAWAAKWYQVQQARRGNVNQQVFQDELRAFVQNTLLPRYTDYNSLTVKNDLDQNIRAMASMYLKNDMDNARQYFDRIVDLSTVARVDPKTQTRAGTAQTQSASAQRAAGTQSATNLNVNQAQQAVSSILDGGGVTKNQAAILSRGLAQLTPGQPLAAGSTRNPVADAVLKHFGFAIR
jgi:hypothetical protein